MILPYYDYGFQITIIDFLIIFFVESFFFFFSRDKIKIKDNWGVVLLCSLLKVGLLSLFISWMPMNYYYDMQSSMLFSVLLLLSGVVIMTLMLQKELLMSRTESFQTAFQISLLSSSVFFIVKLYSIPMYSFLSERNFGVTQQVARTITPLNYFLQINSVTGPIFLIVGIICFFYFNRSKKDQNTVKS